MRKTLWFVLLGILMVGVAGAAFLVGTAAAQTGALRAIPVQALVAPPTSSPVPVLTPVSPVFPEGYAYPYRGHGWGGGQMMGMWGYGAAAGRDCCRGAGWNEGREGWGMGMGRHTWQSGAAPIEPTAWPPAAQTPVSYSADVQPIFNARCLACHGGTQGLYLTDYARVMAGGNHGPVIVPGDPGQSRLIQYIRRGYMPYGGAPLSLAEIQVLVNWVAAGAPNN